VFLSLFDYGPGGPSRFLSAAKHIRRRPKPGELKPIAPLESLMESRHVGAQFPAGSIRDSCASGASCWSSIPSAPFFNAYCRSLVNRNARGTTSYTRAMSPCVCDSWEPKNGADDTRRYGGQEFHDRPQKLITSADYDSVIAVLRLCRVFPWSGMLDGDDAGRHGTAAIVSMISAGMPVTVIWLADGTQLYQLAARRPPASGAGAGARQRRSGQARSAQTTDKRLTRRRRAGSATCLGGNAGGGWPAP
jgi:hypothetical protein